MKTSSILPLLLAMLLAATSVAGCAGDTAETTADASADTTATDTTVTETTRYAANLPMKAFGGETFNFLKRTYESVWSVTDLLVEEQTGEVINDAVFARQVWMEDTYDLTLTYTPSVGNNVLELAKTFVTAGDTSIHAIATSVYDMAALSLEGMLFDLNAVDNIDLSQPWWSQSTNASVSISGKQHYAMGDLLLTDNQAERIYYFNKDMVEDLGLDDLYKLVREGKWTLETMMSYAETATIDLDGDGMMTYEHDQWGVLAQPHNFGYGLYVGAGQRLIGKDADDMPYLAAATSNAIDVMSTIADRIGGSHAVNTSGGMTLHAVLTDNLVYFLEGRALFAPEVLRHIESMRDGDIDIGILPNPKLTEEQQEYYCYADGHCTNGVCIPVSNLNPADMGYVLETMTAESKNGLTEAYFEVCLSSKYVRDPDSVEMLNLVLDSGTLDLGEVFAWGSIHGTVVNVLNGGTAIASAIASVEGAVNAAMEADVQAILGN